MMHTCFPFGALTVCVPDMLRRIHHFDESGGYSSEGGLALREFQLGMVHSSTPRRCHDTYDRPEDGVAPRTRPDTTSFPTCSPLEKSLRQARPTSDATLTTPRL